MSSDAHLAGAAPDLTFSVRPTQWLALVGPSGIGKTSALLALSGYVRPRSGRVLYGSTDLWGQRRRRREAMRRSSTDFIFQDFEVLPTLTAVENVRLSGLLRHRASIPGQAEILLDSLGLPHKLHAPAGTLSGGERQRVAVACAIVWKPQVIFADEPTTALDPPNRDRVLDVLDAYRLAGGMIVMATHDRCAMTRADDSIAVDPRR